MTGITSVEVKESLDEIAVQLRQSKKPKDKERLQVLSWLKQDNPPSISAIAKATGKHRNTLQTWLSMYRTGGIEAMLDVKKSRARGTRDSGMGGSGVSKAFARE